MTTYFDIVIRGFCWFMIVAVFVSVFVHCASADSPGVQADASQTKDTNDSSGISFDEGGTVPVIQMPFAAGHVSQCTQGVHGESTHHSTSTMYDIDFDTSNTTNEQLRAPISGIAYVHMEDVSKNFGYHICIDLGNGTYVILAHMSSIAVKNGESVVAGQFLGYEGCTGYCSGDHVHIGLHAGDARKMGQFGTSIPVRYLLADKTAKTSAQAIECTSLVCGIKSMGDSVNGHMYTSALSSVNAQTSSSTSVSSSSNVSSSKKKSENVDVWIENMEIDTVKHVLNMSTARWLNANLATQDAYVWGTGGCFDQKLTEEDRVQSQNGYYQIDFAKRSQNCGGDFTLISALGTDGKPPNTSMTNWNWWQNTEMCSQGSPFCELQKNGQAWEEWMLRVAWNPYSGLAPSGNGYTKNTQL